MPLFFLCKSSFFGGFWGNLNAQAGAVISITGRKAMKKILLFYLFLKILQSIEME